MLDFLGKHKEKSPVSLHMPGHKGSDIFQEFGYGNFFGTVADIDITEIEGADNLFQAEGIIAEIQKKYAQMYNVKKSYILINGSSCGIIASILSSVKQGKKLLVARNCHKSIFAALSLGRIDPVYIAPEFEETFGIIGAISPQKVEEILNGADGEEIDTLIIPSPNYYGITSDIARIKEVCKSKGVTLIVDQAHGAHLNFINKELSAEWQGADIVINSTHKTLASFTQTAILNVNSDDVNLYDLEEKLQWMQSTSPSYILMASLAANAEILANGREKIEEWKNAIDYFYSEVRKNEKIKVLTEESLMGSGKLDYTKINIDLGIEGNLLETKLTARNIFPELHTGNIMMMMTGIGTTTEHLKKLLVVLNEITEDAQEERLDATSLNKFEKFGNEGSENSGNAGILSSGQIFENEFVGIGKIKKMINIEDSVGMVCSTSIIPYPPGIPLICPGEKITKEAIEYALSLRAKKQKVIGINEEGEISVYSDR